MAIVILPPLVLFLVLQRSFIQGLTAGSRSPLSEVADSLAERTLDDVPVIASKLG